ncbi:uncharacterized protein RJT20DRAFT_125448 [Scheffersomyces xylosifermentans]|uniref:uncharacterized protein n=1 Tax=Scheffersomyces xylosifermentans TaxID=1304137 RepID=UPI00315DF5B5
MSEIDSMAIPDPATFKSTLPPRKRAKTKEEKEQRRVERILRNRRAAHASREKKRKHVEYLESYVLKLEQNLSGLQANFDTVQKLLPQHQIVQLSLVTLEDVSELKEKIHINLTSSGTRSNSSKDDEDHDEDDEEDDASSSSMSPQPERSNKKRKFKEEPEIEQVEQIEQPVQMKQEVQQQEKPKREEDNGLLQVNKDNYYNYLSPVSIHSPINSPIDLTLTKANGVPALTLDNGSTTSYSSSPESTPSINISSTNVNESNQFTFDNMGQNSAAPVTADFLDIFTSVKSSTNNGFSSEVDDFLLTHQPEEFTVHDSSIMDNQGSTSFGLDIEEFLSF